MNLVAGAIGWSSMGPMMLGLYYGFQVLRGQTEMKGPFYACYAVGWWLLFISQVMAGDLVWSTINGLAAAAYTYGWWRNRRNRRRRRALRELGAKSRARIEAMVRRMSPSPIPSPAGG